MLTFCKKRLFSGMLIAISLIGLAGVIEFVKCLERGELIDDSVFVELGENEYQFEILVGYMKELYLSMSCHH